jgi:hypothetical protein
MRLSCILSWWLDQLLHFAHQKVGKNMCETLIQILSVGLGASMFTFVRLMVDRSIVAAVHIDLGVVSFAERSAHVFDVAAVPWNLHESSSVPHVLSCIGIVFNSWLVAISGLGQRLRVTRS